MSRKAPTPKIRARVNCSSTPEDLVEILKYRRPSRSGSQKAFFKKILGPHGMAVDAEGNRLLRIGKAPVMWSCHTDTVHFMAGMQNLTVEPGVIAARGKSNCLGADDSAGIWLMLRMIEQGVPGLYVFHEGEECGGIGSSHIADVTPEILDGISYAIAFDRAGTDDVVTHQIGGRCCSDAFAEALADQLGMDFKPSPNGVFTDTANYDHLIPECTNISVGYYNQHSKDEWLDTVHLERLLNAILDMNLDALPVDRDPSAETSGYERLAWEWDDDDAVAPADDWKVSNHAAPWTDPERPDLITLVKEYPDVAADLLSDYGITEDEFFQAVHDSMYRIAR